MTDELPAYVLISPCRDEAQYLEHTISSMICQSHPPAQWVIVDDGSTDGSHELLADYARVHGCIDVVSRDRTGPRNVGAGVVEAFNAGLATVDLSDYAFVGKVDMDVVMPPRYFETLIALMLEDARLGNASGKAYFKEPRNPARLRPELIADDFSVGAAKLYRVECFRDIGGLTGHIMWDGVDCYESRRHGWRVRSLQHPELRFLHLRPMGSSQRSLLEGRRRHGRGLYYLGASPLFVLATAVNRARQFPRIAGAAAIVAGYCSARARREEQVAPALRRYIRRYQHLSLLLGKRRTMEHFEA